MVRRRLQTLGGAAGASGQRQASPDHVVAFGRAAAQHDDEGRGASAQAHGVVLRRGIVLGRLLVVVHTPRGERVRLISARKAGRGEARHYHA